MSATVVGLILASCVLHALWNLVVKRARNKMAFTALVLLLIPLLYLPMFLWLIRSHSVSPAGWACLLVTGAIYAGYFAALALAYENADLSVAYPLVRGVGPVFTLLWAVLFLGERPTLLGLAGVALIVLAAVSLLGGRGAPEYGKCGKYGQCGKWCPVLPILPTLPILPILRTVWPSLLVALAYSLYSVTDKIGVGRLGIHPGLYLYLAQAACAVWIAPWVLRRPHRDLLRAEWQANHWPCAFVGFVNILAYLLVLHAYSLPGTPISYMVPLRTASVLFAVLLGVEVLGEGRRWAKLGAAAAMMAGIALMAWKG